MWPVDAGMLVSQHAPSVVVIGIETANSTERTSARRQIRSALIDAVSKLTECDPAQLSVTSAPGRPLQLLASMIDTNIGISIAHEAGLSVAAINSAGPVGIDLVRLDIVAASAADWPQMADDYLGANAAARIAAAEPIHRAQQFAFEWAAHEARLKCVGYGLVEWPAAPTSISYLKVQPLALPLPWIGMLAMHPSS